MNHSPTAANRLGFTDRLALFGLTFIVRGALLVWMAAAHINLFHWTPDSWEYAGMASALRAGNWGFYLFGYRTPGYPMVLSAFSSLFNLTLPQLAAWLPFQAALTSLGGLLAAYIVYCLTRSRQIALLGGLLLALEPMMLDAEVPLLSEALFNPAFLTAQLFLLHWLARKRWRDFGVCLVALQLMVLARPTGLLLILVFVAVILAYNRRWWRYALLLVVGFSLPVLLWTARNAYYLHIASYSTIDVYNLLFYKCVSTEAMVTGRSPDSIVWGYAREIELRLGSPRVMGSRFYPVQDYAYMYVNDLMRYQVMVNMLGEKLVQFHLFHLVKAPWSIVRMFWVTDSPNPVNTPIVQIGVLILSAPLVALGVWRWLHQPHPLWQHLLALGVPAYFIVITGLTQPVSELRYAAPFGAYWTMFIALGIVQIRDAWRWRSRQEKMARRSGLTDRA